MARIPRLSYYPSLSQYIDNLAGHIRTPVPAGLSRRIMSRRAISRKSMAYAGAGLAIAGVAGVAAAPGQDQAASPPAHDMLTPVGTSGPQASMPITPARYENAATIVNQAIARHMGLRSAVIAVATSMQESTLLNLPYGWEAAQGVQRSAIPGAYAKWEAQAAHIVASVAEHRI